MALKGFFISSTFKDMQAERDILHERIFPRLRQVIKEYGEDVQEVDLRWGVDTVNMTEEESGHEVLRICIDAIDRCEPYIIVLLGERYGWIPGQRIVDAVDDTRISDRYEEQMSITELEIQYGALLRDEAFSRCVFCFRDPAVTDRIEEEHRSRYTAESEQHRQRLSALKRQIEARLGATILRYSAQWDPQSKSLCGLEDFEEQLLSLLETMIRRDLAGKKAESPLQQQQAEIARLQQEYLSTYVRRYPEEYGLLKQIGIFSWETDFTYGKKPCDGVLLCGAAGQGKSALMAWAADAVAKHKVQPILCFADASSGRSVPLLKQYIAYRLEQISGAEPQENAVSVEERLRALNDKVAHKQVVCFVDGLDQIYAGEAKPYIDLPALCPDILWIFSALPEFPFAAAAADYTFHTVYMSDLTPAQREDLIAATARRRGKKLDDEVTGMVVSRPGGTNPLFLSLVLQRFFMMNKQEFEAAEALAPGMEGLHRYMQQLLEDMPDRPAQMASYILEVTARLFDQQQFAETLMLLALSRNGLSEQELAALLKLEGISFSPIGFQRIVSYLYDAFGQKAGGKWNFRHRLFGEAVRAAMAPEDIHRIKELLVRYSKTDGDFLKREGFYYVMEQMDEDTVQVLESATGWDTKTEVLAYFGHLAKEREEYRAFMTALARQHPSEQMALFYLAFHDRHYGDAVEQMSDAITRILLEEETIGAAIRWRLALRGHFANGEPEEKQHCLTLAEKHAAALQEDGVRHAALARVYAEKCYYYQSMEKAAEEVRAAHDTALTHIDEAERLLGETGDFSPYKHLFNAMETLVYAAARQKSPEEETLTLRIMHILEQQSRFETEADYLHYVSAACIMLSKLYGKSRFRDNDKARQYGDRALELTERAVSEHPTIENLELKAEALHAYCERLKKAYAYPYLEQAMLCVRRCYTTLKTVSYKQELAYAECFYACAASEAVNSRAKLYSDEEIAGYEQVWDHGEQLYAELLAEDPDSQVIYSYASFTADRAQIAYERGYMVKAIAYGEKSVALLEEILRRHGEQYREWVENWLSVVRTTLAKTHLDRLELTQATACIELALPAARAQDRYSRLVDLTLLSAKARYYARDDAAALEACEQLESYLNDPRAEKFANRGAYRWEGLYIRARLALEAGDIALACRLCEESRAYLPQGENTFAGNRFLILLADCQTATGDPDSGRTWMQALQKWRHWQESEQKRYEKDDGYRIYNSGSTIYRRAYRRESRHYAIASYYLAYCYYHCATTPEKHSELQRFGDQALFTVLAKTNVPSLEAIRPAFINVNGLEEAITRADEHSHREALVAAAPFASVEDLLDALEAAPKDTLLPDLTVYSRILHSRPMLDAARLSDTQFDHLVPLLHKTRDRLSKERVQYKLAVEETERLRNAFPLARELPVFHHTGTSYPVWTEAYIRHRPVLWNALLRLAVLCMQYDGFGESDERNRILYDAFHAFRGVADLSSDHLEDADLSSVSDFELEFLIQEIDPVFELHSLYGFQEKNSICTEMYLRTHREAYIQDRLDTLALWLTEPYMIVYREKHPDEKQGTVSTVGKAAHHLLLLLSEKDAVAWAPRLVMWMRGNPTLSDQISSQTLAILENYLQTEEGAAWEAEHRQWLEELKLQCYRKWLDGPLYWLKFC